MVERIDDFQRRHRWAGFPIAVVYKYFDDFGGYLAAMLTYYGFVSLFPLLMLLSTALGILLHGHPDWQERILNSAISEFPVVGDQLKATGTISGSPAGIALGVIISLYGGLGVGQALQYACNTAWLVPRNSRPNPFLSRGRGLLLIMTAGLLLIATTALSAVASSDVTWLGTTVKSLTPLITVLLNAAAFLTAFQISTARRTTLRQHLPGALIAAVLWQGLQQFGVYYVGRVVQHASSINGVFAVVLGLIAFLYVASNLMLYCLEINVVAARRLHPRALLTPFTDKVRLTDGDRRSYEGMARAQRLKGYEHISVDWGGPPNGASGHLQDDPARSHGQDSIGNRP